MTPPRLPELLAPAGEKSSAYAAFAFGADAVYTGLPRFSARAEAVNLSPRELEEIAVFAHSQPRPRRVYVTLNTLVREAEIPELVQSLAICADCGADAVIVQDLGVARIARKHFPALRLHASTQMAIHNLEGVRAAARLGFSRVTLARELSAAEIGTIARNAPCETEAFLHGALCYSYSGLCLYSALLRGRSGNRGSCAYPCRDSFCPAQSPGAPPSRPALLFSMKDLAGGDSIPDLVRAGVASLKIEGRKKSPLYVAAAVNYYRKLLDRSFLPGERERCENDLRSVFSRPWTSLYLRSTSNRDVIDPVATGHRGTPVGRVEASGRNWIQFCPSLPVEIHDGLQIELPGETRPFGFAVEEILQPSGKRIFETLPGRSIQIPLPPGAPRIPRGTDLFLASSQAVKKRYRFDLPNPRELRIRHPVDVSVSLSSSRAVFSVSACIGDLSISASDTIDGPFPPPRNPVAMEDSLRAAFSKLGDTPFVLRHLSVLGSPVFVPVSQLNALRRNLLSEIVSRAESARKAHISHVVGECLSPPTGPMPSSSLRPPLAVLKTDQPSVLLSAFPGGRIPHVGEIVVELGRETPEQIDNLLDAFSESIPFRFALPIVSRDRDRDFLAPQIRHLLERGYRRWEAANLSAIECLPHSDNLDLSADWPLYVLNSAAIDELASLGFSRFSVSPEDSLDNIASLAAQRPYSLVWPILRDPPLFISESCPHAARMETCPGPRRCSFREMSLVSKANERILVVNRNCRFYTLNESPVDSPVPESLPLVPRLDFLCRSWSPDGVRSLVERLAPRAIAACQTNG